NAGSSGWALSASRFRDTDDSRAWRSDRVELVLDIVRDVPEVADIGRAHEGVGVAMVAPVEHVEIAAPVEGRGHVRLTGGADHDRQRAVLFVIGRVEELC